MGPGTFETAWKVLISTATGDKEAVENISTLNLFMVKGKAKGERLGPGTSKTDEQEIGCLIVFVSTATRVQTAIALYQPRAVEQTTPKSRRWPYTSRGPINKAGRH